ncbi:hypothetical protein IV203_009033 [Nitzschia inconspicua]|uniref:Uncharacterized protein n=1 Tax=Nitzschia inconspicua TaxID=303405 RepID=A0A9K3L005_9STRA|nr:hypothetical protein IV203_009033 [Nitzschia inconspicua]
MECSSHEIAEWSISANSTGSLGLHHQLDDESHHQHRFEVRYELDDNSTFPTAPPLDLNKIYASARVQRGPKARSMCSFTTEWSTSTARTSNTTSRRQAKKQQKRRFLLFTKILMRILEKRDPVVYHDAQVVIHDCEQKKKKGEAESVVESLRTPLKDVVGPKYWKEARNYAKRVLDTKKEAPQGATDDELLAFNMTDMTFRSGFSNPVPVQNKNSHKAKEDKVRKKRLWMIICVFMKYLMKRDKELYHYAKNLVSECVRRHRQGDQGYRSLTGSIQTCLKKEIGADYWKRSEDFVAHLIRSNNTSSAGSCYESPFHVDGHDGSFRKRMNDSNISLEGNQKRQRYFEF